MSQKYAERPHFYEGQYLGADDFNKLQQYLNDKQRRHALGMHSWGIVAGLELTEQVIGSDTVVYLQPGYAVDGYGRSVSVKEPYQMPPDLFGAESNGLVKVWLRIKEESQAQNRVSYDACCDEDCFESVVETFVVEAGDKGWLDSRHSGVNVAGNHIEDPREVIDESGDVVSAVCDASISYQEFPVSDDLPYWYIPIGMLMWTGSKFQGRSVDQLISSRAFRRAAGLIGENLFASDGLLRLRARTSEIKEGQTADEVCDDLAIHANDVTKDGDDFGINELVWIEGDLRITGDARLFGSRLEFRQDDGGDSPPLYARRGDPNESDLEITLGKDDATPVEKGATRFVIGTETEVDSKIEIEGKFFVTAEGKVGIGTGEPQDWDKNANSLVINDDGKVGLTIAGSEYGSIFFATGSEDAKLRRGRVGYDHGEDSLVLGAGNKNYLWLSDEGRLGIRTKNPSAPLHIIDGTDVTLGDNTGYLLLGETSKKNIVMDNNEIQARKAGAVSTLHLQAEGGSVQFSTHQQIKNQVIITNDGRIGIGTEKPEIPLHIKNGTDADKTGSSGYLLMGELSARNMVLDDNEIQARNNGNASTLYLQREGGDLKFGTNGKFYAVGSRQGGIHILAGRISAAGSVASGSGFQSNPPTTSNNRRHYHVTFSTAFSSAPAVIVSASDPSVWEDNIANAYKITNEGFFVSITDDTDNSDNNPESSEFNFIAIGT
ncbi:MAG: hypothetical protein ACN4GR_04105 [Arenicellales bacterium]